MGGTTRNKTKNRLFPNTAVQRTASLLSHILKSAICISSCRASLFPPFGYLCQGAISAGHWFPQFPKGNAVKSDAAPSSITTLPLLEPKLII